MVALWKLMSPFLACIHFINIEKTQIHTCVCTHTHTPMDISRIKDMASVESDLIQVLFQGPPALQAPQVRIPWSPRLLPGPQTLPELQTPHLQSPLQSLDQSLLVLKKKIRRKKLLFGLG